MEKTFSEIGLVVFDFTFREVPAKISDDLKSFWGGYQCDFKLIGKEEFESYRGDIETIRRNAHPLNDATGSTKFKVDFSRHEFCGDKEQFEIDGFTIFGYSPRMFVAEKLRAICQQMPEYGPIIHRRRKGAARARDFFDIHMIRERYGIAFDAATFHEIVERTFAIKKVPLEWIERIEDVRDDHEPDFESVKNTVSVAFDLQDFDFYFDALCSNCELLKPLWCE